VREERVALEHHAHRAPLRRAVGEVFAVEQDATAVGHFEAGDRAQERGLAATRRTEKGEELAGLDADVDVVDGGEITETAGDVLDLE
jgi:hypothetical protein